MFIYLVTYKLDGGNCRSRSVLAKTERSAAGNLRRILAKEAHLSTDELEFEFVSAKVTGEQVSFLSTIFPS